jgi:spore coat protein U-like protein
MKALLIALAFAGTSVLTAAPAFATSNTANVSINATVAQSCTTLTSAGALTFSPNYDVFSSTAPTGNTSLSTNCTKGASVSFSVDGGQHAGSGSISGDRALTDGSSHYLSYTLSSDSAGSTPWAFTGSGSSTTATPQSTTGAGNTSGEALTLSIYGSIPTGQDAFVASGASTLAYSDTVVASVNY